jgi:3' terminal RNA ribose 2'-O-methyltransferase Hen1
VGDCDHSNPPRCVCVEQEHHGHCGTRRFAAFEQGIPLLLLTISTTYSPATELSYLLHKHPGRFQSYDLSFGRGHVFYTEAGEHRCTACLLLDVDPVGLVRGKGIGNGLLDQYVNDRPYAASSFLSVAIAQVFGSALHGRCKERPQIAQTPMPLSARIDVLPVRGGPRLLTDLFEPLGYDVESVRHLLDEHFPEWGDGPYFSVSLSTTARLSELLAHLYVLCPVFDNQKHYYIGDAELEKLLTHGKTWLAKHPCKKEITRRYLKFQPSLYRQALARLEEGQDPLAADYDQPREDLSERILEEPLSLNEQRHEAVIAALTKCSARRILDLGCAEGGLMKSLMNERQFEEIVGFDVSIRSLERARERLRLDRVSESEARRIRLIQGSLTYRDRRLDGFDAAALVEVIEHFDPPRLRAMERTVFEFARPKTVVLTTPNREYNVTWPNAQGQRLRHPDHRFEWTRAEFRSWALGVAARHRYTAEFLPVGPMDDQLGSPTQMGVFSRQ